MLSDMQFKEGVAYSVDNFKNDQAAHLRIDKALIKSKFDLNGKRILDFGCGMGGMTLWYATNYDCSVYALDIDAHHIKIATHIQDKYQVNNVTFSQRNILDTPLADDERFDFVFLNDVAEHIPYPVLTDIFRQLGQRLSPGGKIFVTYPPWQSPYASHVTHAVKIPWCQFLPQGLLMRLIEKNNQVIVGEEEGDLVSAYKGLNKLTHRRLMEVIEQTNLKPVFRKTHCFLNNLSILENINFNFFPVSFLVTKEFLLLEASQDV